MRLLVLMKQVPRTSSVSIDPEKGTLRREGVETQTNPYDLHALEAALSIKENAGGDVRVLSMGPPQAESLIREAFWMGADKGYLLTDRVFAGADTLATAYTLSSAAKMIGFDLIVAGMQSTDGDTAQVGPGVAEFLDIPHVSYVTKILGVETAKGLITVEADMGESVQTVEMNLPSLITVTQSLNQPRLPSFRKRRESGGRQIDVLKASDLEDGPPLEAGGAATDDHRVGSRRYFGLSGSPTRVQRMFPPAAKKTKETWTGSAPDLARRLHAFLKEADRA